MFIFYCIISLLWLLKCMPACRATHFLPVFISHFIIHWAAYLNCQCQSHECVATSDTSIWSDIKLWTWENSSHETNFQSWIQMLASRLYLCSIALRTLHMRVCITNFMFSLVLWNMEYNKEGITMQRIRYPVPIDERYRRADSSWWSISPTFSAEY